MCNIYYYTQLLSNYIQLSVYRGVAKGRPAHYTVGRLSLQHSHVVTALIDSAELSVKQIIVERT